MARFTERERSRLRRFRKKYMENADQQLEDKPSVGIPLITQQAIDKLCDAFNISSNGKFNIVGSDLSLEECESPVARLAALAQSYARELQDNDKAGILEQISKWTEAVYKGIPSQESFQNAAYFGTVLVMEIFRLQLGQEFIKNLKSASPAALMRAFDKVKNPASERMFMLDRAKNVKGIPGHQIFLTGFVEKFQYHHTPPALAYALEDGICAMYHVANELWPHLKPSPQN